MLMRLRALDPSVEVGRLRTQEVDFEVSDPGFVSKSDPAATGAPRIGMATPHEHVEQCFDDGSACLLHGPSSTRRWISGVRPFCQTRSQDF